MERDGRKQLNRVVDHEVKGLGRRRRLTVAHVKRGCSPRGYRVALRRACLAMTSCCIWLVPS